MKQELIFRGLLAIAGIWFFARFIAPLLAHYFMQMISGKDQKKNNVDMDILIRRQESLLRKGMEDKKSLQQQSKTNKSNKCLNHYQQYLAGTPLPASLSKADVTKILALHDELQWGDGKTLKELTKSLEKKLGVDYSPSAIAKKVKQLFDQEIPLVPSSPMNYPQIIAGISLLIYLEALAQQSTLRRGKVLDHMANRSMLMPQDIALGFEAWGYELMGKPREQYMKKLSTFSALEESSFDVDLAKLKKKVLHVAIDESSDYLDWAKNQIQLYSELMASIKPVPALSTRPSIEEACQILGVSPKISTENLKKIYKKQAKLRHPDTLNAKKIPNHFEEKARENFVRIKTAYDTIMKDRK